MSPAALSALILGFTLLLFVSERIRHDLVALIALMACLSLGLVAPAQAFAGFADPAVITVAAVLVVGRAIELSGVAAAVSRQLIPVNAGFTVRLALLLVVGAVLSAFMNNIAALVITMPIAAEIARNARKPAATTLMPLAFATILGGMTTLIGTPANLILSSVRETELGAPLGFFSMTPVGIAVSGVGLVYLTVVGWRLVPLRLGERIERAPWRVYELAVTAEDAPIALSALRERLRKARGRLLAVFRAGARIVVDTATELRAGDQLLILARTAQADLAKEAQLAVHDPAFEPESGDTVTARVVVGHGSWLIGERQEEVRQRSDFALRVVAAGPRAARDRLPLALQRIQAGDQLFIRGSAAAIGAFATRARLLEVDRVDPITITSRRAIGTVGIFGASITLIVLGILPAAIAFVGAAVLLAALRLIPADETYRSIDWSVIVLLGAMIPVGQSFETSGAAQIVAQWIGQVLAEQTLVVSLGAICTITMLLSIFLNNVATAIIMGPLAISVARLIGVPPDAALFAVLIGTSSDFLTPIGHQNNLLVMGPGGYRFTNYARMGWILVLLVIGTTAFTLSAIYG